MYFNNLFKFEIIQNGCSKLCLTHVLISPVCYLLSLMLNYFNLLWKQELFYLFLEINCKYYKGIIAFSLKFVRMYKIQNNPKLMSMSWNKIHKLIYLDSLLFTIVVNDAFKLNYCENKNYSAWFCEKTVNVAPDINTLH